MILPIKEGHHKPEGDRPRAIAFSRPIHSLPRLCGGGLGWGYMAGRFTPSPGSAGEGWGGRASATCAVGAGEEPLAILSPPPLPLPRSAGGGACTPALLENAIARASLPRAIAFSSSCPAPNQAEAPAKTTHHSGTDAARPNQPAATASLSPRGIRAPIADAPSRQRKGTLASPNFPQRRNILPFPVVASLELRTPRPPDAGPQSNPF